VPTARLLDQIARARGWDPSTYAPRQEELDRMCQLATHALERAWHFGFWPQLTLTRSVTYRPEWTEETEDPYPLGEQVYWKRRYWECVNPEGTSEEPHEGSADWRPCERVMTCGISYVRYGIEEMDLTRGVYTLNPDTRADARPLPAYRVAFGAVVQRVPGRPFVAMPWIRFRPYAPRLSAVPWANNVAYPKGSLVMGSDGDTYEAWVDIEAGVNPATTNDPAVWAPRRCPRMFEDYVVEAAAAELQTDDNARGRGLQAADKTLNELYNNLVRQINQPGRAMTRVFR
jgi:hypothetical protein